MYRSRIGLSLEKRQLSLCKVRKVLGKTSRCGNGSTESKLLRGEGMAWRESRRQSGKWEGLVSAVCRQTVALLMSWEVTKSEACELDAAEHMKLQKKV